MSDDTPVVMFHIGDLVTVYTGRLVAESHMDAVYTLVDHVEGPGHMTHQLPDAMDRIRPALLEAHPWLADIDAAELDAALASAGDGPFDRREICSRWVDELEARFGTYHPVATLASSQ